MEKIKEVEDFNSYDEAILDIDEVPGTDIKINPDYYIHNAILKAQAALNNDNLRTGIVYYTLYIDNMESMADAAKMLPEKYKEDVEKFKKEDKEYLTAPEDYAKEFKLATYKMKLILGKVFAAKVSTRPAKA